MTRLVLEAAVALVALLTLAKGLFEYMRQGAQKEADRFIEMRERFKGNQTFSDICLKLEGHDKELEDTPYADKRDFLGFFQELALLVNSGFMPKEIAHYMFAYYARLCWHSDGFWDGINKYSPHWALFRDFAKEMDEMEEEFLSAAQKHPQKKLERSKYRF
jgi:hypothetical protein